MRTGRSSGLDPSLEAAHRRAGELGGMIPSPGDQSVVALLVVWAAEWFGARPRSLRDLGAVLGISAVYLVWDLGQVSFLS